MTRPRPHSDPTPPSSLDDEALPPPAHIFEQLQAAIAAESSGSSRASEPVAPAAVSREHRDTPQVLWIALALIPAGLFVWSHVRLDPEVGHIALKTLWPSTLLAALGAAWATFIARSRGTGLGPQVSLLGWISLAAVPLSMLPLLHRLLQLASLAAHPDQVYLREPHCGPIASFVLLSSLYIVSRGMRHSAPAGAGWRSTALGAAAGAWTGVSMLVFCPDLEVPHLLLKHMAPVVIAPFLGLLLLRRYVRI